MGLIRQLFVTYSVLLATRHAAQAGRDTNDEFNRLAQEQHSVCSTHVSCLEQNITDSFGSPCCGSCTCYPDCSKYGSCCLSGYESLADARIAIDNTRFGCVSAQYYPADSTKYITDIAFWMISKCDPSYPDNSTKKFCEIPPDEQSVDSFIPVTEMTRSMTTYRNVYCAYCNNIASTMHLLRWPLIIHSEKYINTSTASLNELNIDELKRDGVYIIFEQPMYLNMDKCHTNGPSYHILSCNETGLWSVYNRSVEQACNAYIDPFNDTFKNYFCYLCNSAEQQPMGQWKCKQIPSYATHRTPFTTRLDTRLLVDDHERRWLWCDKTQVPDKKIMVCRNISCYGDRYLKEGMCVNFETDYYPSDDEHCLSAFIKATPSNESQYYQEELAPLYGVIFRTAQINSQMWAAVINFHQLDIDKNIKYVLSYLLVKFYQNITRKFYDDFFKNILSLKRHKVSDKWDSNSQVTVEFKQYNITFSDGTATVIIPNQADASFDVLTGYYYPLYFRDCLEKEVLVINKIYMCPFLELPINDYSLRIENTFLYFDATRPSDQPLKVLENWEYEDHGDKVYICLEDFLDIYENVVKRDSNEPTSTVTTFHNNNFLFLIFKGNLHIITLIFII